MTPQPSSDSATGKARAIIVAVGDDLSGESCIILNAIEVAIEYLDMSPDDDFIVDTLIKAREAVRRISGISGAITAYGLRHGLRPGMGNSYQMLLGIATEPPVETPPSES